MKILQHKQSVWNEGAYGIASLGIAVGVAIGAVCVPASFDTHGNAPVFAMEESGISADGAAHVLDYGDVYAEDAAALHAAYLKRMQEDADTQLNRLNSLTHHGASWGLRDGRVDFINLNEEPKRATLGQPNPNEAEKGPHFKRPLDAFEEKHLGELTEENPLILENVNGNLRMLGLVPKNPAAPNAKEGEAFGVLSYHFIEIADD